MSQPLPIDLLKADLVAACGLSRRLVLRAPTGSGKSTRIPQMLLDLGLVEGQIVVLQPRRIAARLLAARIAQERGVKLGGEVGYQIRFERVESAQTRIKFVTEALLLRQMASDPQLKGIGAVVFDEFHERNLHSDVALALARRLQEEGRPDLLIVAMSATLDTEESPVGSVRPRRWPPMGGPSRSRSSTPISRAPPPGPSGMPPRSR